MYFLYLILVDQKWICLSPLTSKLCYSLKVTNCKETCFALVSIFYFSELEFSIVKNKTHCTTLLIYSQEKMIVSLSEHSNL